MAEVAQCPTVPADRARLAQLVRISNHNYGTSVPVEVVEDMMRFGFTSIARLEQDAVEDFRPCGRTECDICQAHAEDCE